MGLLKLKKNKRYNYTPRYYKKEGSGSPFDIKHKFDEHRKTVGDNSGIKTKFTDALNELKEERNLEVNRRILIIAGVLILLFLFIIDFDLSIFLP